jgi:mono/diheme cytochrome c family protein
MLVCLIFAASAQSQSAASDDFAWQELGEQTYRNNCSACHQADGRGISGVFPPVAKHMAELYAAEGADYLKQVLLYGLQGEILVEGQTYNGSMPGWRQLEDEQIAAVINYGLTAWDSAEMLPDEFEPVLPEAVAAARQEQLTPQQVHELRSQLAVEQAAASAGASQVELVERDGWYTLAQAERGEAVYRQHCAACHGDTLRGSLHAPRLTDLGFFRNWNGRTADTLHAYTSSQMPLGNPGSLGEAAYIDILAYWLSFHDYPAGELELTADPALLQQIVIGN